KYELWTSDGTTAGTESVYDLEADPNFDISNMQAVGDQLYFSFDNGDDGRELWTSDGTPTFGTKMVKDINPGPGSGKPGGLLEYNGLLYFKADNGVNGIELWRTDGTLGGTELFADLRLGGDDSNGLEFGGPALVFGGELFISGDFGLYKTNGIPGDVEEMFAGVGSTGGLMEVNGALYITIPNAGPLYTWDGTAGGTELVVDGVLPPFTSLVDFDGNFYGAFDDGVHGVELWRSDLTTSGTERLTDINPSGGSLINEMIVSGEYLYFRGADADVLSDAGDTGVELWAAHVDQTAPDTSIDSGPAEGEVTGSDPVTFTFSSNEPDSVFSCSIDGGAPEPCNSGTRTYSGLAAGAHSFSVTAADPAPFNNVDPSPAVRSFQASADKVAPTLKLRGAKKQKNPRRIVLKATCVNENCTLKATGKIKVKILKPNGKVKKTKTLKLKQQKRSAVAGKQVKLKLKLNKKAKKLVKRVFRKKASVATVTVRATDPAGNTSKAKRKVKVLKKSRR
ncbi:MAG: hypothetical protein WBW62_01325, partial [Solirubrobacterales bacterium]